MQFHVIQMKDLSATFANFVKIGNQSPSGGPIYDSSWYGV